MEYASHVWGGSTLTGLLDSMKSKTLRFLLTAFYLKFCRHVASLSIFCRYFHADCSFVFANCMPLPLPRLHYTRLSTHAHPYTIQTPYARANQHFHSYIPFTGKLWNSPPSSVFPLAYDLTSFKKSISRHLFT